MSAEIISALKAMKLHGMASHYPEVAAQARHTDFTPEAFLTQLLKAETAERAVRSMPYQMGAARFPAHRDLAGFEFAQQAAPAVDRGEQVLCDEAQHGMGREEHQLQQGRWSGLSWLGRMSGEVDDHHGQVRLERVVGRRAIGYRSR